MEEGRKEDRGVEGRGEGDQGKAERSETARAIGLILLGIILGIGMLCLDWGSPRGEGGDGMPSTMTSSPFSGEGER